MDEKITSDDELVDDGGHKSFSELYSFSTAQNNFHQCYSITFVVNCMMFSSAEQYVLYCKALFFKDRVVAKKILGTSSPIAAKTIGRRIKNVDDVTWNAISRKYVIDSMFHKFGQNSVSRLKLMNTEFKLIAKMDPDKLWDCGGVYADIADKSSWRGDNWLGECLMLVRAYFKNKTDGENLYYYMRHIHIEYYYDMILKKQKDGLNGSTITGKYSRLLDELM